MKIEFLYKNGVSTSYSLKGINKDQITVILDGLQNAMRSNLVVDLSLLEAKLLINTEELSQVVVINEL